MSAGKNSLIYIGFNIAQKAISLILVPVLTYFISKEGMGKITLLTTLVPILVVYCGLALYGAGTVFTYKIEDPQRVKQLWGNINLFTNIFGIFFVLVMMFLFYPLQNILFEGLQYHDYLILLAIVFFNSVYGQYQAYLQAHKKAKEFARNALAYTIINVLLVIVVVVGFKLGYRGYYYAFATTNFIFYLYAMWHARQNYSFKFDGQLIKNCLKYAIPLLPHATFGLLLAYTDRIFVNRYWGMEELGVYGVACQFAVVFSVIINGFSSSYSPFSFEKLKTKDYLAIRQFCMRTLAIFSIVVVVMSLFSREIFFIIVKHSFIGGWVVLPLFAFAYMFQLGYVFFINNLFFHKPAWVNLVTGFSGVLNLSLNLFLTKHFGIVGATLCTLFSSFCSMTIAYYLSLKIEPLGFAFKKILSYQCLILLMSCCTYLMNYYVNGFLKVFIWDVFLAVCCIMFILKVLAPLLLDVNLQPRQLIIKIFGK